MIDFTVPPELDELRLRVREFIRSDIPPFDDGLDDDGLWTLITMLRGRARAAGLYNPQLPEAYGGLGLGPLGMALVSQECGPNPLASYALNCMAPDEGNMHLLLHAASPEQAGRYLRPLAEGRIRSCFAMTERDVAGSDPTLLRTRAIKTTDGWTIDGAKWFITGAAGASVAIVVAQTDPDAGRDGYTLFLVDATNPGWRVVRPIPTLGFDGLGGHCEVVLSECRVGDDAVLGEPGRGFALSQIRLGPARLYHAMRWIGIAQAALDMAASYSLEREAFGSPLADKQGVQWMLADSALQLYQARLMVLHAAWLIESGREYRQEVSMVKFFVAEALNDIVDRALQIHGSLGYSKDTPIERWFRDARAARIYDGASEVHRMVIARNVLRAARKEASTRRATGDLA